VDPTDERDPLMLADGAEREYEEEEDGPTLTGRKILDDLEAQRGNGNGTQPEGKYDSPGTSASSGATIRPPKITRSPPPPNDRRSSTGTVESYHLRPISRENSNAGPSANMGFKVPTLHVTKPSADWEWNAQDEWGEDPFDETAEGGESGKANGSHKKRQAGVEEADDDGAEDAWGSMEALDGPKEHES